VTHTYCHAAALLKIKAKSAEVTFNEQKVQLATAVLKEHLVKRGVIRRPASEVGAMPGPVENLESAVASVPLAQSAYAQSLNTMQQSHLLDAPHGKEGLCAAPPTIAAQEINRRGSASAALDAGQGIRQLEGMLSREGGDVALNSWSPEIRVVDASQPGWYPCF
jgi:hypothetical protein